MRARALRRSGSRPGLRAIPRLGETPTTSSWQPRCAVWGLSRREDAGLKAAGKVLAIADGRRVNDAANPVCPGANRTGCSARVTSEPGTGPHPDSPPMAEGRQMATTASFARDPSSPAAARRFVAGVLEHCPEAVVQHAVLMVSELATNAVQHARSSFRVTIEVGSDAIRVEVRDEGEGEPVVKSPKLTDASGTRPSHRQSHVG